MKFVPPTEALPGRDYNVSFRLNAVADHAGVKRQPHTRRTFLFLQGPHGRFFPMLGAALEAAGQRVGRINLNGGDHATWPSGVAFRGRTAAWPEFMARYIAREGVSDLVLFGDSRPLHVEAIAVARDAGVRIHIFEEGYIRPDWVTLERDGVNGHSRLPRDPSWYLQRARDLPPLPEFPPLPSYASARGLAAAYYHAEVVLQHWRFPFYRNHRVRDPVQEGLNFLRRYFRREAEHQRCRHEQARLSGKRYFLFPLQLDSDYQIRVHSPFGAMRVAIEHVLKSFAKSAPPDIYMAIKEHPLDGGLNNWRAIVTAIAESLGIAERVVFLEQGDLDALVRASSGLVTVNSTCGTLALASGRAVKVLGDAVYDLAGITDQGSLEAFWCDPTPPDADVYDAFCRVLGQHILIHGAFLSNVGIDRLVASATARLLARDDTDLLAAPPMPRLRQAGR